MADEEDRIEECSVGRSGSCGESRWVDGSEVEPEASGVVGETEPGEGFGLVRRRLIKKPKRVDSLDVEAMEIAGAHGHGHSKVN